MKITKVSCDQFAGVRALDVRFADGLNVVCGRNESGKSTLVALIAQTLFKSAELDRRSDKAFVERFFPTAKKGGTAGECIDGKVSLEAADGVYTLVKEWGDTPRCKLMTPSDVYNNPSTVEALLKAVLGYGEGVYTELLLSPQTNAAEALKVLLDTKDGGVKRELADVVSQAFAESDGVSIEAVERTIAAKIAELAGEHWDVERGAPERKKSGGDRHKKQVGLVLAAYYAWEDACAALQELTALETEAEREAAACAAAEAAMREADEAYARFGTFAGQLETRKLRAERLTGLERQRREMGEIIALWPEKESTLKVAQALLREREARRLYDRLAAVKAAQATLTEEQRRAAALPCPDEEERRAAKTLAREMEALEKALCGMNLQATVAMQGGHTVQVTSLRTGEAVDISRPLTEAVRIVVPDVMEMTLAPANVDAEAVQAQLSEKKAALEALLAAYAVESAEALEALAMRIEKARAVVRDVEATVARLLDGLTMEALEAAVTEDMRAAEAIESDIRTLCGAVAPERFIAALETKLDDYAATYTSLSELKAAALDVTMALEAERTAQAEAEDVPEEYRGVTDVAAYRERLRNAAEERRALHNAAIERKTKALTALAGKSESEASAEAVEVAERELEELKALLAHWLHIQTVFAAQKAALGGSPMQGLAERFAQYLGVISGGRVASEFPEEDKLNMTVYSAERPLDHAKLSEGTKDTVSLAFRLAVLDHLFPDGGGVIVFDDPLTDMDAERTAQAVALIQACAARHQVIFLTCKEELADALGGRRVEW